MSDIDLPNFDGTVIKRGDVNYESECYQYASSSYLKEDIIRPMAIIKAANDNDVIKAIKYASDNKIAVAVRTGGHHYCGASSTNGKNIQLDLSQTYKDFQWKNENCTLVTLGVSLSLGEFNTSLRQKNRFVPHGQCQYVNMGGHIQTGGYGQLARSFGLLSDYVEEFRIITADGQARWVDYQQDKDLFFAVLGGSPGNFGVLTHIKLNVFRDEDHPNSRGLRAVCPYNRQYLRKLLDIMVEMAEDDNFPADYDYCVTVLEGPPYPKTSELTYDQRFNHRDPSQQLTWIRMITIFVQWANLEGKQQNYDSSFVDKILGAAGITSEESIKNSIMVSDKEFTPISTLCGDWMFPIEREFDLPYIKRVYSSNSSSQRLKKFDWTRWISKRVQIGSELDLNMSVQFQHFGGSKSRFFRNTNSKLFKDGKYLTSFSWRDTHLGCEMDAFYHDHLYEKAKEWIQGNDKGVGNSKARFCEYDRRLLWGSHDLDLSANWKYYYDQEGKYKRLCEIKKKHDPSGVFTPNRFCIGLSVPEDADSEIVQSIADSDEEVASVEPELSAEEKSKFLKTVSTKRKIGKPISLWDIWRS